MLYTALVLEALCLPQPEVQTAVHTCCLNYTGTISTLVLMDTRFNLHGSGWINTVLMSWMNLFCRVYLQENLFVMCQRMILQSRNSRMLTIWRLSELMTFLCQWAFVLFKRVFSTYLVSYVWCVSDLFIYLMLFRLIFPGKYNPVSFNN